jgi:hypothetical protein
VPSPLLGALGDRGARVHELGGDSGGVSALTIRYRDRYPSVSTFWLLRVLGTCRSCEGLLLMKLPGLNRGDGRASPGVRGVAKDDTVVGV